MNRNQKILLVEPAFPYPAKSKNRANNIHKNFVPIGLLKLGAFYKAKGNKVKLVRGTTLKEKYPRFKPNLILVSSLFTYWSKYVWDAIKYYRAQFPEAVIMLGGIYATLHAGKDEFEKKVKEYNVKSLPGLHQTAEKYLPDYSLLESPIDYHVTHAMRGCIRRCSFCGTWKLEPERTNKNAAELIEEITKIGKNKIIFFDNNFLANEHIKEILNGLSELKINGKPTVYESQSGFDGRLIEGDPKLALLIKKAHFRDVRFAWDNGVGDYKSIGKQINLLVKAGYLRKDISVFVIYNYDVTYDDMLKKLQYCKKWGVQIADCRYRPLESTFDNYDPAAFRQGQTNNDYYIHTKTGWTDEKIRDFRRRVRQHNIWVRYGRDYKRPYSKDMERWSDIHSTFKVFKMGRPPQFEYLKSSPTWRKRIQLLNKVKNYYKQHNMNSLDFSVLNKVEIDEKLKKIIKDINKTKLQLSLK